MRTAPPTPRRVVFHASFSGDRVYLCRRRFCRYLIEWHTWSNFAWSVDQQQYDSLEDALASLFTWLKIQTECTYGA